MRGASQVFTLTSRACRLTISPAYADTTLLIRRVVHLADRAGSECARSMRALGGAILPACLCLWREPLDSGRLEHHGALLG